MMEFNVSQQSFSLLRASFAVIALVLTACGGGSGGTNDSAKAQALEAYNTAPGLLIGGLAGRTPENIKIPWLGVVRNYRYESLINRGHIRAYFLKYNNYSMDSAIDFYSEELDTCVVEDIFATEENTSSGSSNQPPLVDAGTNLIVTAPEGVIYTLEHYEADNLRYQTSGGLAGPLPEGATLYIPGNVLPGPISYPLYEPSQPERLLPDKEEYVTVDTAYSWIPGSDGAYVELVFQAFDFVGNYLGRPIVCKVVDDGAFTLPADALELINESDYQMLVRYARIMQRLDIVDELVIYHASEVIE